MATERDTLREFGGSRNSAGADQVVSMSTRRRGVEEKGRRNPDSASAYNRHPTGDVRGGHGK